MDAGPVHHDSGSSGCCGIHQVPAGGVTPDEGVLDPRQAEVGWVRHRAPLLRREGSRMAGAQHVDPPYRRPGDLVRDVEAPFALVVAHTVTHLDGRGVELCLRGPPHVLEGDAVCSERDRTLASPPMLERRPLSIEQCEGARCGVVADLVSPHPVAVTGTGRGADHVPFVRVEPIQPVGEWGGAAHGPTIALLTGGRTRCLPDHASRSSGTSGPRARQPVPRPARRGVPPLQGHGLVVRRPGRRVLRRR
jgi:hypothetical protein